MTKDSNNEKRTVDGHTYDADFVHTTVGGHLVHDGLLRPDRRAVNTNWAERADNKGDADMPGKVDEAKWDEAKAKAKKQYPDLSEDNPRLWKIISTIYKTMGGKFHSKLKKSLDLMENICKVTPTFISNPRLWVRALEKSGGSLEKPEPALKNLGLVVRCYAEMGGTLQKSSMLDNKPSMQDMAAASIASQFEKAGPGSAAAVHKYESRIQKPGGGWKYSYAGGGQDKPHGRPPDATGAGYKKIPKKPGQPGVVPEGYATSKLRRDIETLEKKPEAERRAALQNVSYENISAMLGHVPSGSSFGKQLRQEADSRKTEAGRKKPVQKSQSGEAVDFESFRTQYLPDVEKSLAAETPGLDHETLQQRAEATLRQMYRYC